MKRNPFAIPKKKNYFFFPTMKYIGFFQALCISFFSGLAPFSEKTSMNEEICHFVCSSTSVNTLPKTFGSICESECLFFNDDDVNDNENLNEEEDILKITENVKSSSSWLSVAIDPIDSLQDFLEPPPTTASTLQLEFVHELSTYRHHDPVFTRSSCIVSPGENTEYNTTSACWTWSIYLEQELIAAETDISNLEQILKIRTKYHDLSESRLLEAERALIKCKRKLFLLILTELLLLFLINK